MFSTLIVVSFLCTLAWVQQQYLNRLIKADIEYLKSVRRQQLASIAAYRAAGHAPDACPLPANPRPLAHHGSPGAEPSLGRIIH